MEEAKESWMQWSVKNTLLVMILLSLIGIIIALYMKCKPDDKDYQYYKNQYEKDKQEYENNQ